MTEIVNGAAVKGALRSWTMRFAILLAAFGAAQENLPQIQEFVSPESYGYWTMGIAVVVAVLRIITTKSLVERANA